MHVWLTTQSITVKPPLWERQLLYIKHHYETAFPYRRCAENNFFVLKQGWEDQIEQGLRISWQDHKLWHWLPLPPRGRERQCGAKQLRGMAPFVVWFAHHELDVFRAFDSDVFQVNREPHGNVFLSICWALLLFFFSDVQGFYQIFNRVWFPAG